MPTLTGPAGRLRERELLPSIRIMGTLLSWLYELMAVMRLLRVAKIFHRPQKCVKQIARCIQNDPAVDSDGLRDVYFGHTHVQMDDLECEGMTFHNTGSAIRGMPFIMMKVQ